MAIPREITARFAGRCSSCGRTYKPGTRIIWSATTRETHHVPDACPKFLVRTR